MQNIPCLLASNASNESLPQLAEYVGNMQAAPRQPPLDGITFDLARGVSCFDFSFWSFLCRKLAFFFTERKLRHLGYTTISSLAQVGLLHDRRYRFSDLDRILTSESPGGQAFKL